MNMIIRTDELLQHPVMGTAPWSVLVFGGSEFTDRDGLTHVLDGVHEIITIGEIIHQRGDAVGILAGEWALSIGIPELTFDQTCPLSAVHLAIAFPGDRETLTTIQAARTAFVPVLKVRQEGENMVLAFAK